MVLNIDEKFGLKPKPKVPLIIDSTRNAVKATAFFDVIIFARAARRAALVSRYRRLGPRSTKAAEDAMAAIAESPWTVLIIGLRSTTERAVCEQLAGCSRAACTSTRRTRARHSDEASPRSPRGL